jgi:hypothetical protein
LPHRCSNITEVLILKRCAIHEKLINLKLSSFFTKIEVLTPPQEVYDQTHASYPDFDIPTQLATNIASTTPNPTTILKRNKASSFPQSPDLHGN